MIGTEEFGQATVAPPRVRWWLIGCVAGLCSLFLLLVFWIDRSLPTIGQMRDLSRRTSRTTVGSSTSSGVAATGPDG